MKTTRTILAVGAVLSAVMLVGCTHTVDVVISNRTAKALPVTAKCQGVGVKALGSVAAQSTLIAEVDIPSKELPTDLIIEVGNQALTWVITEDVSKIRAFISLENDKLMKRGDDPITEEKKIDTKRPKGDPESIIE